MVLETDPFTVTLPSNSNMSTHVSNTPADYTVRLRRPRELVGDKWEVALRKVHYPINWRNVTEDSLVRVFFFETEVGVPPPTPTTSGRIPETVTVKYDVSATYPNDVTFEAGGRKLKYLYSKIVVPSGYYNNITQIGERIASAFKKKHKSPQDELVPPEIEYIYDVATSRGRFVLARGMLVILLENEYLSEVLGHSTHLKRCQAAHPSSTAVGVNTLYSMAPEANKQSSLEITDSLYVYCDFIEDQAVGDQDAKLLGIVPSLGTYGQRSYWTFVDADYVAVSKRRLTTLSIRIKDDKGQPVKFAQRSENLVCTVHFKPKGI